MAAKVSPIESEENWDLRNNEVRWIKKKIKMRKCSYDMPSEEQSICQRGYDTDDKYDHAPFVARGNCRKRVCQKHTLTVPTDAFGEIEFVGFGGNIGKFVRVDQQTDKSDILDLMMNVWALEKPNLVISVAGGARNFIMKQRLRDMFLTGLMKAAHSTGAWIITGGTHAGVMKHVGEAIKDYGLTCTDQKPVVAIGIAPWGVIQNRDALINKEGSWPAEYRITEDLNSNESFLDPNHSHFILIDNATEIPFRAELEREISQMQTETGDGKADAVSVPIVTLVVEGGPDTLEMVQKALVQNIPVVIVKGSGRAADILSYAFKHAATDEVVSKENQGVSIKITEKHLSPSLEAEIHKQMKEIKFCPDHDIDINMQRIKDCLAKSELIHIFEWDSDIGAQDIDVAMLKAVLKVHKNKVMDQLKLALAWNRIDIAKSEIFTDDERWRTGSLDDLMLTAIQLNRAEFVELFLDKGVSLKEFLSIKRLLLLYNSVSSRRWINSLFSDWLGKQIDRSGKKITLKDLGELIQNLLGYYYVPHYISDERYTSIDAETDLNGATSCKDKTEKKKNPDFDDPAQELFIWSVLTVRQEMAKLFWSHEQDAIAAALVATALLRAMSKRTDNTVLIAQMRANANQFTDFAVGILNEAYSTDEKKTQNILIRELSRWEKRSCVQIAVKSRRKRFISQTACQDLFKNIWMGQLSHNHSFLELLICTVYPPLFIMFINFKLKGDGEESLGDHTTGSNVQMKVKSQPLHIRGRSNASLPPSHPSLQELGTANDSGNERTVKDKCLTFFEKLVAFIQAPMIIFYYNVLFYVLFLCFYSYYLISILDVNTSVMDFLLIVWVFTIFTEEIRQVYKRTSGTKMAKFRSYKRVGWNQFDFITMCLFVIGMALKSLENQHTFDSARIVLGVNLVMLFIRLLRSFAVHKNIGPKVVMTFRAVWSLFYFALILLVFIVAYAIASYAILYPKTELNVDTFMAIFRRPYWNIYGELMLDEIEGAADCTNIAELYGNGTHPRCPTESGKNVVTVMMGIYMLMCNILLLNLIIAMFSYTFQTVQDNIDLHWNFQLHDLICDYSDRPFLAPPLILIEHILEMIIYFVRMRHPDCFPRFFPPRRYACLKRFPNETELCQWESDIADTFRHKRYLADQDTTDYRVKKTVSRMEQLVIKFDQLQDQLEQLVIKFDQLQDQLKAGNVTVDDDQSSSIPSRSLSEQKSNTGTEPGSTNSDQRMENIENQAYPFVLLQKHQLSTLPMPQNSPFPNHQLQWIVESLKEHQLGAKREIPEVTDVRVKEKKQTKKKETESSALVYHMLEGHVNVHSRSRTSPYPGSNLRRFEVPNDKVSWDVDFPEYDPPTYISHELSKNPDWADKVDLYQIPIFQRSMALKFNSVDLVTKTSRVSYVGNYQLQNGIPMNPIGRTGLVNRGSLGRWGPNHVVDPVITRWKYDESGQKIMKDGKPVFEFVAVRRMDTGLWALPESILVPGRLPTENLKIKFSEEALGALGEDRRQKEKIKKQMEKLLRKGELIHQGYADDPRNTDNAWLESTVYLYQDENHILRHFSLTSDAGHPATWMTASRKISLDGAHSYFLKLGAERLGASF